MFEALGDRLTGVFDSITGKGALSEKDVSAAMREIRIALLEADVALPVVKDFITQVKAAAIGEAVIKSVKPGQQVVKIVNDALIDMLGGKLEATGEGDDAVKARARAMSEQLNLSVRPPAVIVMAGLQGSGKTTTAGKLAKYLKDKQKKKVLLASLDTRRPAAMEQLGMLAKQAGAEFLPIVQGQSALEIAKRAIEAGRLQGMDVVFLDTAGRTTLDDEMMDEAAAIVAATNPVETLLVADSLTGQDAVQTAERFNARLPLTGLILTRIDGDGRGGAALSMRAVTGLPIKFLGTGEKLDGLEAFDAARLAGRILGQGDIVSLVEKAAEVIDQAEAEKMAKKMQKGTFDLQDLSNQLGQMQKMGGMGGLMKLMPGMGKVKKQIDAAGGVDDKLLTRQRAIIQSMTPAERAKPELLKASRKKRIAAGCGMDVADVNKLLKMHRQMADMMKKMGKGGLKGMMQGMGGMPGMGAGMGQGLGGGMGGGMPNLGAGMPDLSKMDPSKIDSKALAEIQKQMGGGFGKLPGLGAGFGSGSGMGGGVGKLPGLGGAKHSGLPSPFGKKK